MYSQKPLLNVLSSGSFGDLRGRTPKRVETIISNVFIGEDRVYKVYKNDSASFNEHFYDLSVTENRMSFSERDFNWNHDLSPEIYIETIYAKVTQEIEIVQTREEATEVVIVMSKVDVSTSLTVLLMKKLLKEGDYYRIGSQLGEKVEVFNKQHGGNAIDLYEDFIGRYNDIVSWMSMATDWLPSDETGQYLAYLKSFIDEHEQEFRKAPALSGVGLDVHAENALYDDGELSLIDTYPPKEAWRKGHKHINIYRIAADIYALQGEDAFREYIAGYENSTKDNLDPKFEKFFVMYAALIMCPQLYMMGKTDPLRLQAGEKYHDFLKNYFTKL